jgi:hypothetical protein
VAFAKPLFFLAITVDAMNRVINVHHSRDREGVAKAFEPTRKHLALVTLAVVPSGMSAVHLLIATVPLAIVVAITHRVVGTADDPALVTIMCPNHRKSSHDPLLLA